MEELHAAVAGARQAPAAPSAPVASGWDARCDAALAAALTATAAAMGARLRASESRLGELERRSKLVRCRVETAANRLRLLANTQFIEARVYEEEPGGEAARSDALETTPSRAAPRPELCPRDDLAAIASASAAVRKLLDARPLPLLIGSAAFKQDPWIGLKPSGAAQDEPATALRPAPLQPDQQLGQQPDQPPDQPAARPPGQPPGQPPASPRHGVDVAAAARKEPLQGTAGPATAAPAGRPPAFASLLAQISQRGLEAGAQSAYSATPGTAPAPGAETAVASANAAADAAAARPAAAAPAAPPSEAASPQDFRSSLSAAVARKGLPPPRFASPPTSAAEHLAPASAQEPVSARRAPGVSEPASGKRASTSLFAGLDSGDDELAPAEPRGRRAPSSLFATSLFADSDDKHDLEEVRRADPSAPATAASLPPEPPAPPPFKPPSPLEPPRKPSLPGAAANPLVAGQAALAPHAPLVAQPDKASAASVPAKTTRPPRGRSLFAASDSDDDAGELFGSRKGIGGSQLFAPRRSPLVEPPAEAPQAQPQEHVERASPALAAPSLPPPPLVPPRSAAGSTPSPGAATKLPPPPPPPPLRGSALVRQCDGAGDVTGRPGSDHEAPRMVEEVKPKLSELPDPLQLSPASSSAAPAAPAAPAAALHQHQHQHQQRQVQARDPLRAATSTAPMVSRPPARGLFGGDSDEEPFVLPKAVRRVDEARAGPASAPSRPAPLEESGRERGGAGRVGSLEVAASSAAAPASSAATPAAAPVSADKPTPKPKPKPRGGLFDSFTDSDEDDDTTWSRRSSLFSGKPSSGSGKSRGLFEDD